MWLCPHKRILVPKVSISDITFPVIFFNDITVLSWGTYLWRRRSKSAIPRHRVFFRLAIDAHNGAVHWNKHAYITWALSIKMYATFRSALYVYIRPLSNILILSLISPIFLWHVNVSYGNRHIHIAKLMGPTWGSAGSYQPQMGPMLAPSYQGNHQPS